MTKRKKTPVWIIIMIIIFILLVTTVLSVLGYLFYKSFSSPAGDECQAWINEELIVEHTCIEKYICVSNRYDCKSIIDLAEGHGINNPAIGVCRWVGVRGDK